MGDEQQSSKDRPIEISQEAAATASVSAIPRGEFVRVVRVIDGDTIEIEGGKRVRYIGINTPEIGEPHKQIECFAAEAKRKNSQLVEGKDVLLVKDNSQTDTYNRLLRYVHVGGIFVNDVLVRQGFARVESVKPDIQYAKDFSRAQQEAQDQNKGLWSACKKF